jgi:hypothetical protein
MIMDIYTLELESYKREISNLESEIKKRLSKDDNLTLFALAMSNRCNLILVGLCSLVEVLLYEIALKEEDNNTFKISDLKGSGIERLQSYLSKTKKIDFGKIKFWSEFKNIYTLRNAIVHCYGGLVKFGDIEKIKQSLKILKMEKCLVLEERLRLTSHNLSKIFSCIENTINTIKKSI